MQSLSSAGGHLGRAGSRAVVAEAVDQHVASDAEHQQRDRDAERPVLVVEVGLRADLAPG